MFLKVIAGEISEDRLVNNLKIASFLLMMASLFSRAEAQICTLPLDAFVPRGETLAVPASKVAGKSMRNVFIQELEKKVDELAQLVDQGIEDIKPKKLGKLRKFFVIFRHFSEIYSKQGALPESLENLAFLPGKVVDALRNGNTAKAKQFLDRLREAISTENRAKIFADIGHLKIAKTKDIIKNIEASEEEIGHLLSKKVLNFEEFHDLKKGVRRFVYILKYRIELRGEDEFAELAKRHEKLLDMLGETTDEIAELKLEISRKELQKLDFAVTPEIRELVQDFVKSISTVYDF
jgi:hypothetical protein